MRHGRRPGDSFIPLIRSRPFGLRKSLGVAGLYATGYGNVGSSIYYALGVVAIAAMGATPVVLGIAGVLFVFTALTYAEGSAMYPEAGGSASFARHAFGERAGFLAGWALLFSYVVTIAISAFTIPPYLGFFWAPLKESQAVGTLVSMAIVGLLMGLNIVGVKEASFLNVGAAVLDVLTQLTLIIAGLVLLLSPALLWERITGSWPSPQNLLFGIALASLAYTGVETISQMAEETRRPQVRVPQALVLMIFTVLVIFGGIAVVAFSAMTPEELATKWATDPVAGIAFNLPLAWLQDVMKPLVAVLAASILLIATNAGIIGISRLAFSMGVNRQLPAAFGRVHHRFRTPYLAVMAFTLVALLLLVPGFVSTTVFQDMGALYTFGSLLSFAFAHASILALRIKEPQRARGFKLGLNLSLRGRQLPLTALLGLLATAGVWVVIVYTQSYSRWVGFCWLLLGLVLYTLYQRRLRRKELAQGHPPR
ncbi:MAG: APC family permease [Dehalococcoidia bacterium]|nr:APC family permease [Dehalococcoidia bacterium]